MKRASKVNQVVVGALALTGLGVLSGCKTDEIQAIAAGVQTVADTIVQLDNNNSISNLNFSLTDLISQFTN